MEWKGVLSSTLNMGKGLRKLFKYVLNDISQALPTLGEFGSEVSYSIREPVNFGEVTTLSEDIKKHLLEATLKEIQNLINNQNLLVQDSEKCETVTPCVDVHK